MAQDRGAVHQLSPSTTLHGLSRLRRSGTYPPLPLQPKVLTRAQVLRMDISLLGNLSDTTVVNRTKAEKVGDGEPVNVVDRFLKRYATAKIIIVIDTHAVEGGWLTYGGNTPSDYKACCLEDVCPSLAFVAPHLTRVQILAGCIPPSVFQFISDAVDSPVHNHRSLIVNLACGASVKLDGPRHSLLQG